MITVNSQASNAGWTVVGARPAFLRRVRLTGRDDLGQAVVRFRSARGGEPLRDQFRHAVPGEEVLLGSHGLFDDASPFREFGPIYVSANLPSTDVKPEELLFGDYFRTELVVRRYDRRFWIGEARRIAKGKAAALIREWLSQVDTAFVDARFPEYGCFACRFVLDPMINS